MRVTQHRQGLRAGLEAPTELINSISVSVPRWAGFVFGVSYAACCLRPPLPPCHLRTSASHSSAVPPTPTLDVDDHMERGV